MRVEGHDLFYRLSTGPADAVPILHVHGFGISGSYLMPTARLLVRHGVNIVPDLPGYGRSHRRDHTWAALRAATSSSSVASGAA